MPFSILCLSHQLLTVIYAPKFPSLSSPLTLFVLKCRIWTSCWNGCLVELSTCLEGDQNKCGCEVVEEPTTGSRVLISNVGEASVHFVKSHSIKFELLERCIKDCRYLSFLKESRDMLETLAYPFKTLCVTFEWYWTLTRCICSVYCMYIQAIQVITVQ